MKKKNKKKFPFNQTDKDPVFKKKPPDEPRRKDNNKGDKKENK